MFRAGFVEHLRYSVDATGVCTPCRGGKYDKPGGADAERPTLYKDAKEGSNIPIWWYAERYAQPVREK